MAPNPEDRLGGTDGLEFEPVATRPKPKRHWGRWVSFAVVVIVGAGGGWYYFGDQMPMGDEQSVPFIRADIAPIKIKPANPGGMEVPDRDKLVYNRLKGESAGTNVERLLPPPESPLPLPESSSQSQLQGEFSETADTPPEPLTPESLVPESTETGMQPVENQMAAAETALPPPPAENAPVSLQPAQESETPAVPAAPVAPPPPPAPVEPVEAVTLAPTSLEPATTESSQTASSQVASAQPSASETIIQPQSMASAATAQTKEYRIQLAALRSHERAGTEWKRQKKAHPDLLGSLKLFVVRVDLGDDMGIFYRLRAGPLKDSAAAKALCGELAKRNVGCLVIRPGK